MEKPWSTEPHGKANRFVFFRLVSRARSLRGCHSLMLMSPPFRHRRNCSSSSTGRTSTPHRRRARRENRCLRARLLAFRWRAALHGGSPNRSMPQTGAPIIVNSPCRVTLDRETQESARNLNSPVGTPIHEGDSWAPRIAPDGDSVAFYTLGPKGVGVAIADRSGRTTVLSDGWRWMGRYLAWSPSGDEVWFSATKGGDIGALRGVTRSGRERIVLNLPGSVHLQDVSVDGRVLLTYGNSRVEVRCRIGNESEERNLSWFSYSKIEDLSRDGKLFLFGERGSASPVPGAYVRRTDGSPAQRLADCRPISLSPDGKWVVCHDELADDWTVFLVPTGPGEARRMRRRGDEGAGFGMGWLPDSKHGLEAWRKTGGRFQTYIVACRRRSGTTHRTRRFDLHLGIFGRKECPLCAGCGWTLAHLFARTERTQGGSWATASRPRNLVERRQSIAVHLGTCGVSHSNLSSRYRRWQKGAVEGDHPAGSCGDRLRPD